MRIPSLLSSVTVAALLAATASAHIVSEKQGAYPVFGEVERLDPALDSLISPNARMHLLATGFEWAEGPVWHAAENQLLFSDVPENIVYRWTAERGVSIFLHPSGYTGLMSEAPYEEGSNGLMIDADGNLVLCQHGNRQIGRLNPDGHTFSVLANRYMGKRFNSPNDLVRDKAGNILFTDPPYGLENQTRWKEQEKQGIYRLSPSGQVTLIYDGMSRPNGIGLSPDEKTLYVGSTDGREPWIMAIPMDGQGNRVGEPTMFFDGRPLFAQGRRGGFDGLKVDQSGNVWASGPGGIVIISPEGKNIGNLLTGRGTANIGFGGANGTTVFITADDSLLMIESNTRWAGYGW